MIKGHFWFKQTSNGNLIGEYCNDHIDRAHTESADIIPSDAPQEKFIGSYKSSWYESSVESATLHIAKPSNSQKYFLEWHNNSLKFKGEATIVGELLVGNYESV